MTTGPNAAPHLRRTPPAETAFARLALLVALAGGFAASLYLAIALPSVGRPSMAEATHLVRPLFALFSHAGALAALVGLVGLLLSAVSFARREHRLVAWLAFTLNLGMLLGGMALWSRGTP